MLSCLDRVAEPANKRAMFSLEMTLFLAQKRYRTGTSSVSLLFSSYRQTGCHHMMFLDLSPFYRIVNKKLDQLSAGGLIEYWYQNFLNFRSMRSMKASEIGPQVLTIEHLGICFLLWLVPLNCSIVVFLSELFVFLWPHVRAKLEGTLTAWFVVRSFMRARRNH